MLKKNKILLEERIPIKTIEEPFCKRCMNNIEGGKTFCGICEFPPAVVNDWYFNNVKCLGKYNYFGINNFKIPINILSILISLVKSKKKTIKPQQYAGKLLADGLFQFFNKFSDVFDSSLYLAFSPNSNKLEKNQCEYIVNPLLKRFKKEGINITDISNRIVRVKDVGKNKDKGRDKRFNDIKGVHKVKGPDLNGAKILIIDDVYTTGSTSWDLSRALKEQNAGEINVLAAGRHIFYNEWIEKEYCNFDELILYFSNLDIDRTKKRIYKVKIKELKEFTLSKDTQIVACIKGSSGDYKLIIDFTNKKIKHDCYDFNQNKKSSKRFCKHITKVFITIRDDKGDQIADSLLKRIYNNLDEWEFNDFNIN